MEPDVELCAVAPWRSFRRHLVRSFSDLAKPHGGKTKLTSADENAEQGRLLSADDPLSCGGEPEKSSVRLSQAVRSDVGSGFHAYG